jgi:lysophospholipase L1-like esterase
MFERPPQSAPARRHLLQVLAAALCVLVPLYALDAARTLRPTRVLGPVGLPSSPPAVAQAEATGQSVTPATDAAAAQAPSSLPPAKRSSNEQAPATAQSTPAAAPVKSAGPAQAEKPVETAQAAGATGTAAASAAAQPRAGSASGQALLPIEGIENLRPFYSALARTDRPGPVRVLHYGDSTLAGDGIAKTVRRRLKAEFGDGGPGFFVAGMDPRWMRRDDVRVDRSGEWDIFTILHGGNQGRYGLGGIVAKPRGNATGVQFAPARSGQALGQKLEIYTQKSRRSDALRLQINGAPVTALRRIEHTSFDQWLLEHPEPIVSGNLLVQEGGLEIYGLALETAQGVTWETTAVVGIASGSIRQFNADHLADQTRVRQPELIVVMLGGNDAGHGGILQGDGKIYRDSYVRAVTVLRRGAPGAACLLMSPTDQAMLDDEGRLRSKQTMARMVELQRQASRELGCAFWDSWQFMGGPNAFARWLQQGLAWTDLMHLTEKGLNRIGQGFADALLHGYEQHRGRQ